ncbi:MFS family permease [Microbacteriaceae bacterium SG_E_30_P1]|uniref:MFS family permease n=1 Tax=Antiquaquibacter oligotrophicus TaxID=2880260 RepID=A0ABT6KLN7_9MICO|nr:MFS transporter [Antiquaquibacter oligotrophicus]MDH6180936.1 MFS family permease [Antiquaquibacter oligotrophicus]UDF13361.1 MFS transporter [Antiquaquibacter oligotrophicus]
MAFGPFSAARSVVSPYLEVLNSPRRRAFVAAAWAGRFPKSGLSLGLILLIALTEGSYAIAGAVAAVFVIALAISGPRWSRAMDRYGVRRVLPIAAASLSVFAVALLCAITLAAPLWAWFVLAALTGLSVVDMGSVVRARWVALLSERERLPAFALESINDELVFVISPPVITIVATLAHPSLGFALGLAAGVGGYLVFALLPSPERSSQRHRGRARLHPGVFGVIGAFAAMGIVFGSFDISVVALAESEGAPVAAGLLIGVFALASVISGTVLGSRSPRRSRARRFILAAVAYSVAVPALALASNLLIAGLACAIAGLVTSPLMITGLSLVESRADHTRLTETLAYPTAAIAVGGMIGAAAAGYVIDGHAPQAGFLVAALAAVTVIASAGVGEALASRASGPGHPNDVGGLGRI